MTMTPQSPPPRSFRRERHIENEGNAKMQLTVNINHPDRTIGGVDQRGRAHRFAFRGLPALMLLLCLPLAAAGCADRTYLTKSHGRAYAEAFDRQAVPPQPRSRSANAPEATEGLDSQEAAAIAGSYRRSLAGKEGSGENAGHAMVITNSGAVQPAPYMPPPSVPNGQ